MSTCLSPWKGGKRKIIESRDARLIKLAMKLRATDGAFKIIRDNVIIVEATHLGRILVEGGCMRVDIIPSSEWKILLLLEFQFDSSSSLILSLEGRKENVTRIY